MSQPAQDPRRSRPAEQAALNGVIERLAGQFPELPREQIVRAVHGQYGEYTASPVRDFVPVLVERGARRRLSGGATASRRG